MNNKTIPIAAIAGIALQSHKDNANNIYTVNKIINKSLSTVSSTLTAAYLTTIPNASTSPLMMATMMTSKLKDGSYIGSSDTNMYGVVQVEVTIASEKITNVKFLKLPSNLFTSQYISSKISPLLKQRTITSQYAEVNIVNCATVTSTFFQLSLRSALSQAC